MNILVIGNGFDLAHGLPTNYIDFLIFLDIINGKLGSGSRLKNHYPKKVQVISNYIDEYLNGTSECDNIIKELKNLSSKNFWIEYFFLNDIVKEYKDNGWIDFELEISKFIKSMIRLRKENKVNEEDNKNRHEVDKIKLKVFDYIPRDVNQTLCDLQIGNFMNSTLNHLEETVSRLQDDLNKLIRCLEIYLTCIVEKIHIDKIPIDINKYYEKVLSFNYTNTYKRIYDDGEGNIEYDYVHGKVDINRQPLSNNMVLGINELSNDSEGNIQKYFIEFEKFFQRTYKKTSSIYKMWLKEHDVVKDGIINIYIFGHSSNKIDKDILKELIEHKFTKIIIYYHNKDAYKKLIKNLMDMIGPEKFKEYLDETNKKITFVQSNGTRELQY